uniref:Helix-hairpin-helix motif protein n=1 Tax=mine drainage metagenome TaxID=410659 RepID=E6PRK5_9ZZZZ
MKTALLRAMLAGGLLALAATAHAATEVNTATQSELESIHGLGVTRVEQILAEREHNGPYTDAADLAWRIPGLGRKSVRQLQENGLSINGQTAAPSPGN